MDGKKDKVLAYVIEDGYCVRTYVYVIVVAWLLRVYGICTLSVVLCTPEGEARGSTYNYTKGTYPYTRESHVTANLYYMIEFTISTSKN